MCSLQVDAIQSPQISRPGNRHDTIAITITVKDKWAVLTTYQKGSKSQISFPFWRRCHSDTCFQYNLFSTSRCNTISPNFSTWQSSWHHCYNNHCQGQVGCSDHRPERQQISNFISILKAMSQWYVFPVQCVLYKSIQYNLPNISRSGNLHNTITNNHCREQVVCCDHIPERQQISNFISILKAMSQWYMFPVQCVLYKSMQYNLPNISRSGNLHNTTTNNHCRGQVVCCDHIPKRQQISNFISILKAMSQWYMFPVQCVLYKSMQYNLPNISRSGNLHNTTTNNHCWGQVVCCDHIPKRQQISNFISILKAMSQWYMFPVQCVLYKSMQYNLANISQSGNLHNTTTNNHCRGQVVCCDHIPNRQPISRRWHSDVHVFPSTMCSPQHTAKITESIHDGKWRKRHISQGICVLATHITGQHIRIPVTAVYL